MGNVKNLNNGKYLVSEFTGAFVYVIEPHQYGDNKPEYTVTMLLDKDDPAVAQLKKVAGEVAKAKWGAKIPKSLKTPFKDGDEKADAYPEFAGKITIKAANKNRQPVIIDRNKNEILDPNEIYSGAKYRAIVTPYAYDNVMKGVNFGLELLQKVGEGERVSGGASVKDLIGGLDDLEPLEDNQTDAGTDDALLPF